MSRDAFRFAFALRLALALALLVPALSRALTAQAATHVDVGGRIVAYYPDLALVSAEGPAAATFEGHTVRADGVRYDTNADRLIAAGNVHVNLRRGTLDCAAYSFDLRSGTQRYIANDGTPRAYVLKGEDPTAATVEAPPAGTFEAADLGETRAYITGRRAIVIPQTSVRMNPATFDSGAGPKGRLPTFLYTFSSNSNLFNTSLPTATFDQPFGIAGSPSSYTQLHLRYDNNYGAGIGLEQHLVNGNRAFISVGGVAGRTPSADFFGYTQVGARSNETLIANTIRGLNTLTSTFANIGRVTSNKFVFQQQGQSSIQSLFSTTLDRQIPHLIGYNFTGGFEHDYFPGATPLESAWFARVGGALWTLSSWRGPWHTQPSVHYDYTLNAFNFPHETTSSNLSLTLSRTFRNVFILNGGAQFSQSDSLYRYNAAQYLGLPSPTNPYYAPDGTPYPGYFAFAGLTTQRTYSLGGTYTPNAAFRFGLALTHAHDFPDQYHGYGRPPLAAAFDLRVRVARNVSLEYTRTYTFGWNGLYFAPGANLTLSQ